MTLTLARSIEAREATWSEIDFDTATWTVPAERMKVGRTHRVPLSRQALDVLQAAKALPGRGDTDLIFPSRNGIGQPPTDQSLRGCLNDNMIDCSPHGFRASFGGWCMATYVHPDLRELSLAHVVGDRTVTAYARLNLLDERRRVMHEWTDFIAP